MSKVTIFGYHGMKNYGDDFFLDFILRYCEGKSVTDCYVIARRGSLTEEQRSRGITNVKEILPTKRFLRGYDKWISLFTYALRSDYLVFCAGSIFTILPETVFLTLIKLLKWLKPNIKIIALGVSVGPFATNSREQKILKALGNFDFVLVRDKKSLTYGLKNDVSFLNDLAFTHAPKKVEKENILGIALNPYISVFDKEKYSIEIDRNNLVVESISRSDVKFDQVKIFVTCDDELYGDNALAYDLRKKIDSLGVTTKLIRYGGDINYFETELATTSKLIASRLHAGFFALLNGSHVFQLKYAEKIQEFYRGLNLESISFHSAYEFEASELEQFLNAKYIHSESDYRELEQLSKTVNSGYLSKLREVF